MKNYPTKITILGESLEVAVSPCYVLWSMFSYLKALTIPPLSPYRGKLHFLCHWLLVGTLLTQMSHGSKMSHHGDKLDKNDAVDT